MATSFPVPAGLPLDAASWAQTPLVVRQLVVRLLAVIEQQAGRIAGLEARVSQLDFIHLVIEARQEVTSAITYGESF